MSNQRSSIISWNDEKKENKQKKSVARSITDHNLLAIADEEANEAEKPGKKAKLDKTDEWDDHVDVYDQEDEEANVEKNCESWRSIQDPCFLFAADSDLNG